jgi:putative transposase
MARLPRLSAPGWPHLLIQRGHNRQPVFIDDADRQHFLDLLNEGAKAHHVSVHAYSLLDAEVRLLVTPKESTALSRLMQTLGRRYGSAFNRRHGHIGGLWEGRFKATVIEPERYLLSCMQFIEEAELGNDPNLRPWSSAAHHVGQRMDLLVTDHSEYWLLGNTPFEREAAYRKLLEKGQTPSERAAVQNAVMKAWPLGSPAFVKALSLETSRRLIPLPRGRPSKKASVPN